MGNLKFFLCNSSISFRLSPNSASKSFHVLSMVLQVLTWSFHHDPFGIACRKRCNCSSLSCSHFIIRWLNSFFQVAYALQHPSHFGTGNRCRSLNLDFDTKVSAIFATVVDIVDIDDVKASKVTELLEVSEEFCSFWYAANFEAIWRKSAFYLQVSWLLARVLLRC